MNIAENNIVHGEPNSCFILTSSSANLDLHTNDIVEKAYLYWAGSGTGDFEVKLNDFDITPDIEFHLISNSRLPYFSAFKDITNQILTTGNGIYTLSDLDLSGIIDQYCPNATNFAGWAIAIVYKNNLLPINQINVYHGLQGVPNDLTINLSSLNVLDTNNSKVGFIAWEGDASLPTESFYFNGHLLSNALNPPYNVFNGTNAITGSDTLYNMDLDVYNLQGNINIGDTTAQIKLTSSRDFIMINTVVTKLNNQLPDATITINSVEKQCDSKTIVVNYTVSNLGGTNPLPTQTPIAIYANGVFLQSTMTNVAIPIGGSINAQITLTLPANTPQNFQLKFVVDDTGNGTGIVAELIENNNSFSTAVSLLFSPTFNALENITVCNEGFTRGTFDFSAYEDLVKTNPLNTVRFYETLENATSDVNPILNSSNYSTNASPKEIFVRISNEDCFSLTSFLLTIRNCPPTVYNFISANTDNLNDYFTIDGLRDVFLDFRLEIYSRWGRLLWTGNRETGDWNGYVKDGFSSKNAPDGTYFYLLFLNDIDYPEPLRGFLYLNH